MAEKRSSFTGKIGFVLAAAGSAVGLGNIWRFPYLAAKYGGGIFLLIYIILAVTFGFSLMVAEIAIGRKTGSSAINAFKKLDKRFSILGWMAAIVPAIILPYYSVIGGWVTKYLVTFASGGAKAAADGSYFDKFISSNSTIGWFLIFMAATAVIVFFGVEKGIEKVSKIMMPILVLLTLGIAIYVVTLPGAMDGVVYYLKPNFSNFRVETVLAAMGQLFYSMSLAMGIMITYGSYMKKDVGIENSVRQISLFDTGIAFLAGLMIIPAVFVSGDVSLNKGPGLMFVTLPKVFEEMPGGVVVGVLFFVLVLFAALTSSISLMETVVSILQDKFKMKRPLACVAVFGLCLVVGIPTAMGYGTLDSIKIIGMQLLDFFDFISNSVLMPIVALLTCIFVGYVVKIKTVSEEVELNGKFKMKGMFNIMIRYIAPIFIIGILVFSLLEVFGIIELAPINIDQL